MIGSTPTATRYLKISGLIIKPINVYGRRHSHPYQWDFMSINTKFYTIPGIFSCRSARPLVAILPSDEEPSQIWTVPSDRWPHTENAGQGRRTVPAQQYYRLSRWGSEIYRLHSTRRAINCSLCIHRSRPRKLLNNPHKS